MIEPGRTSANLLYPRTARIGPVSMTADHGAPSVKKSVSNLSTGDRPGRRFAVPMPLTRTVASARPHRPCRPSAEYWPRAKTWACESASVLHGAEVRLGKSAGNLRSYSDDLKSARTMIPVGKYATGYQTNRLPHRRHPMDALQPIGSNLILRNFSIFLSENPSSC